MDIVIWIIQGIVALLFMMDGIMKVSKSKEELSQKMGWVEKFPKGQLKIIGLLEIIGSIGIVLPMILSILEELTVVAAVGLSLVMMGAIATHARRKEYKELKVNFFILLLLGFVITGRVILVPVL